MIFFKLFKIDICNKIKAVITRAVKGKMWGGGDYLGEVGEDLFFCFFFSFFSFAHFRSLFPFFSFRSSHSFSFQSPYFFYFS